MTTRNDSNGFEFDEDAVEFEMQEMDDEEIYFEEDDMVGEDFEPLDFTNRYKHFSARRRIEIAREDKWLQSVMADFEDFEDFDLIGDSDGRPGWKPAY